MPLKQKIVALGVLPLVLASAVICGLVISLNRQLGDQQAQLIENTILANKQAELKNYVALAQSLIGPLYADGRGDEQAQKQVLELLHQLSFGINGYFFVYDRDGRSLMHPRQPELVGQDLSDLKDSHGLAVIIGRLKASQSGAGFQRYAWNKPSSGQITEKLSYVVTLDHWGWMLGTGIYLEDVEQATQQARDKVAWGVHRTMLAIAAVALVAVLLVFVGGMMLNVSEQHLADRKLRHLTRRIINLQEEERARISRELHDGISQLLVSLKFKFELAGQVLSKQQHDRGLDLLKEATERLGEAIGEVRNLSHDLRSSLLDSLGLSAAIAHLAAEFEQRTGLSVNYSADGLDDHVADRAAVSLFRIAQEGLANIERHAQARSVAISLLGNPTAIRLILVDDGIGFNVAEVERSDAGIGLRNIRERIGHFGGRFELTSKPGRTELDVLLPLNRPAEDEET